MATVQTRVDKAAWRSLKALAAESGTSPMRLLREAVEEYVDRRRVRPGVIAALEAAIEANADLGRRLDE